MSERTAPGVVTRYARDRDVEHVGSALVALALFCLIVNVFFLRGFPVGPITTTYLITLWAAVLAGAWAIHLAFEGIDLSTGRELWPWYAFLVVAATSLAYNLLVLDTGWVALRFWLELALNVLVGLLAFRFATERSITTIYTWFVAASAVVSVLMIGYGALELEGITRIGRADTLPIGVNHLGHGLAVGAAFGLVALFEDPLRRPHFALALVPILVALILAGSRSSLLALALVAASLVLLAGWRALLSSAVLAGAGVLGLGGLRHAEVLDARWEFMFERLLAPERLLPAMEARIDHYREGIALATDSAPAFLFGIGIDRYGPFAVDAAVLPHNYWISLLVFVGAPALVLFTYLYAAVLVGLARELREDPSNRALLCTLLALLVVTVYASFSGRLTRVFSIWVFLGIGAALVRSAGTASPAADRSDDREGEPPDRAGGTAEVGAVAGEGGLSSDSRARRGGRRGARGSGPRVRPADRNSSDDDRPRRR